jgi:predicted short-subunit dehydrogenase-like oxidoreductase (DUF2520 family)
VDSYYNIALIGAGNLAWHLAPALENAGHRVVLVYSRNARNSRELQDRLYNAEVAESLDFSQQKLDYIILCVSDDVIEAVVGELCCPPDAVLLHTSGSQPISLLHSSSAAGYAVMYPLQTFTKGHHLEFAEVPILIEAEEKWVLKSLEKLTRSLSGQVVKVAYKDRLTVHVAAVFACNFSNYLFGVAESLINDSGFDLDILRPLIAETLNKSLDIGPRNAQTGPAARGDENTINTHMEFLQSPEFQKVYQTLTQMILNR